MTGRRTVRRLPDGRWASSLESATVVTVDRAFDTWDEANRHAVAHPADRRGAAAAVLAVLVIVLANALLLALVM